MKLQDERIKEINELFKDDFEQGAKIKNATLENDGKELSLDEEKKLILLGLRKFLTYNLTLLVVMVIINFSTLVLTGISNFSFKTALISFVITLILHVNMFIYSKMGLKILKK